MKKRSDARGKTRLAIDYRSAPLPLLELIELSCEGRLLMTWLLMHGNGWEFKVGYALGRLGISESTWLRKVRPQLIEAGFFKQRQFKGEDGSPGFSWENEFTDEPLLHLEGGRLSCQFEGIQTERIQTECIQDDRNTEAPVFNKGSSKQKRESKARGSVAAPPLSPGFEEDQTPAPPAGGWRPDRKKEEEDTSFATRIGRLGGLSDQEIEAAFMTVQYPSERPGAVRSALDTRAAAAAAAAKAAALAAPPPGFDTGTAARGAAAFKLHL